MKLLAFKVCNFRSIVDSGWCNFSRDRVTVFVGQNESGKTSILEALHCILAHRAITEDDLRAASPPPTLYLRCLPSSIELERILADCCEEQVAAIHAALKEKGGFEFRLDRGVSLKKPELIVWKSRIEDAHLEKELQLAWEKHLDKLSKSTADNPAPPSGRTSLTTTAFAQALDQAAPRSTLFNAESGLLPNRVDIDDEFDPVGQNYEAAANFISIAQLDLRSLVKADTRTREYVLAKANAAISNDFNKFWTQTIGHSNKINISCKIENYGSAHPDKIGKSHLVFLVGDGLNQLYPKQRSQGVRWFISFYLQLRASEQEGVQSIFLMDEPGANLHPKAQEDVLRLINQLSDQIEIVYSTHNAALLEYTKLYRVHAVQRDGEQDDSPTVIIDAHKLGAASTDTLTPLLTAMGTRMHEQNVVRKKHNVLLEEMSGFYYLQAFWALTKCQQPAYFIAASGASNIPAMAYMFRGWGLQYIVVVDDDGRGREVFKTLKRDLFGQSSEAEQHIWKIKDCTGIEDVFSQTDFATLVVGDLKANTVGRNSDFLRKANLSKPVIAYKFWDDVRQNKITKESFEKSTWERIEHIVSEISSRLALHGA